MVIEPLVQCAAGMVMHPPGYLRGVRELTRKYDVLLIADEIAVGFGRTGTMFACEQEERRARLPVPGQRDSPAATCRCRPRSRTTKSTARSSATVSDGRTLHHGHTFGGNPLAAAAALATLDVFDEEQTLAKLPAKIARLGEHLCRLAEHPHVATTRQRGLIGALELTPDKATGTALPRRRTPRLARLPRSTRPRRLAPPARRRALRHAAAGDLHQRDRPNHEDTCCGDRCGAQLGVAMIAAPLSRVASPRPSEADGDGNNR